MANAAPNDAGAALDEAEAPAVQPLPSFIEPELPSAEPAMLARLDAFVEQLLSAEPKARAEALALVPSVDASWLPAVAERFDRLAAAANKPALEALLDRIRKHARERREPSALRASSRAPGLSFDALELVVAYPDRSSAFLRPLTEVLTYARMFEAIATLPAARRVLGVYVRFGEFLRVDTQLALQRMQDTSVAALIEATAHPVPRVGEWAKKQLEDMGGKHVASEAVQVQDPTVRADILRAYGKTLDVETARLLISFAASERAPIRLAARQAVTMLGEAGLWQLRDAYEKTVGERAPREWAWDRLARELFAQFDRQRLSEIYRLYNQGREAERRGDLGAARAAYDQVLAWDPMFEQGPLMAKAYITLAEQQADADPEAATLALRRAERLAPTGEAHDRALSLRYTLDARSLLGRGIVDDVLVQRARELDPNNARAARLEQELEREANGDRSTFQRYAAAALILVLALIALIVMAIRQRKGPRPPASTPANS
jgi:hypothetical protein